MNKQLLTNKNSVCSFMFQEQEEATRNWSTGPDNMAYRTIKIRPLKLDKHSIFFLESRNLFTRIGATPYYATRQQRKRGGICDVTI